MCYEDARLFEIQGNFRLLLTLAAGVQSLEGLEVFLDYPAKQGGVTIPVLCFPEADAQAAPSTTTDTGTCVSLAIKQQSNNMSMKRYRLIIGLSMTVQI